jgi:hypothetical protein
LKTQLYNKQLEPWSQTMILAVESCYLQRSVIGENYAIWVSVDDTKKCLQVFND